MQLANHTQIPNSFIEIMGKFTGEEVKIFLAICRKTIGWHKVSDKISYSQLKKLTGIKHHVTLQKSIKNLCVKNMITQQKIRNGFVYDINFALSSNNPFLPTMSPHDIDRVSPDDRGVSPHDIDRVSPDDRGVSPHDIDRVSPDDNTKDIRKETNIKEIHTKIFNYWNSLNIMKHTELTPDRIKALKKKLKECTADVIMKIMDRYNQIIKDKDYYFDTVWNIENFLNRKKGFDYFKDTGEKWINYMAWKSKQIKTDPDEILKRKKLAQDEAQKKRDQEHKIKTEEVNKFREETGGVLNLTEEIDKKINKE